MGDVVVRAESLGKSYVIGHRSAERVPTLRDAISRHSRNFVRTTRDMFRGNAIISGDSHEEFWALRQVGFEIERGDVLGIIGRNGAGKSTLLKVLSRITEPTEGRVTIKGRVASLLEVGTGFHPELTGRENIYLNGAILGMTRAEIRRKFDEIVEFAGVERFLDTPVKRYSSGMYVRLAFSVAAHLEPEILIIDEVLAVGDAEFQKKCLGKMKDVASAGRTVLFVSHNLSTVSALCSRAIYLQDGNIKCDGTSAATIQAYRESQAERGKAAESFFSQSGYRFTVGAFDAVQDPSCGSIEFELGIEIETPESFRGSLSFFFKDEFGRAVGACSLGGLGALTPLSFKTGLNPLSIGLAVPRLAQGSYNVDVELIDQDKRSLAVFAEALAFESVPPVEAGHSEVLSQSWGFGSVWPRVYQR